jgi:pyrrolidone-carboxylate peptidase
MLVSSGGNYLSNEIYYRVAKLRAAIKPSLPTGHLHIPLTQSNGDFEPVRGNIVTPDIHPSITLLLNKIKEIINKL